jgi:hypothetical protein
MIISACSTWLCTPTQFDGMPVGTQYVILSSQLDLAEPFTGKLVVAIHPQSDTTPLILMGYEPCPEKYPNGVDVYDDGVLLNWETKQAPEDPCAGYTDSQVLLSATLRGLI